jgi:Yip1 domain
VVVASRAELQQAGPEAGPEAGIEKRPLPAPLLALVAPDVGMERVARSGRVRGPLLAAMVCALLAAAAGVFRVDARDSTLRILETTGQLANSSDRQIEDATKAAERIFMVKDIAGGAVEAPVLLVMYCLLLFTLSWFLRGRSQGRAIAAVAAVALLPGAIANLLEAGAILRHVSIPPDGPSVLPRTLADFSSVIAGHPLAAPAMKLLSAFDVFSFWSALLLGFGLATASQLPLRRALTGTLIAWVCIRLLFKVAMGGN